MDIELQFDAILAKFTEKKRQNKTWTDLKLRHLNQYRKVLGQT